MKNNKWKQSFSNRKFKMGSFQTIVMILVLVVVIILNILVSRLNFSKDMNSDYLYSLSNDTISYLSKLQDDITIYYLVEDGSEAISAANTKVINVENIVNLYGRNSHIKVEKKNPVLYPNFAKEYTDQEITDNDVIVVNNRTKKSQYLSFEKDMIEKGYDVSSGSYQEVPQKLKMESAITSAIQKVTLTNTKKVYVVNDLGTKELVDDFYNLLSNNGMDHEEFSIAQNTEVPEDCDLFVLNSPSKDLTKKEYQYLSSYLKEGGKAMFFLNYTAETPFYDKLLKEYGIIAKDGIVMDPDEYSASYGAGMYMLLMPKVCEENDISADTSMKNTLAWYSRGLVADKKVRGSLTMKPLLQTSGKAYLKSIDQLKNEEVEKTDKDESGAFAVAMTATDTHAQDTKGEGHATKLFVCGSAAFTSVPDYASNSLVSIIGNNNYDNRNILVCALSWLVGDAGDQIEILNIPDRSLLVDRVTLSDSDVRFWTAALLIVIPMALLLVGFLIWNRRRKK